MNIETSTHSSIDSKTDEVDIYIFFIIKCTYYQYIPNLRSSEPFVLLALMLK